MYKICFYVPHASLETVKNAVFQAGAGAEGNYEQCAWQTKGEGQFRPLEGSNPFVGEKGKTEIVEEYKVEIVCKEKNIKDAIAALKKSHPYEQPAYDIIRVEDF